MIANHQQKSTRRNRSHPIWKKGLPFFQNLGTKGNPLLGNNEAQGRTLGIAAQGPTLYWGGRFLHKCATVSLITMLAFADLPLGIWSVPRAHAADTVIILTTANSSPWTVPLDWNNVSNTIEVVGAGGNGVDALLDGRGGGGGGGGAYAKVTNLTLTPGGTASFQIVAAV